MSSGALFQPESINGNSDFYTTFVNLTDNGSEKKVTDTLDKYGFVTFEGMRSPEDLLRFGQTLGRIIPHPDADISGITTISPNSAYNNLPGKLGLTDRELVLHTDGTAVLNPANLLMLYCEEPALSGGETKLLDGKKLYDYLSQSEPEMLNNLQEINSAAFGKWDSPFIGSVFEKNENGLKIRFRADDLGYYNGPIAKDFGKLITIMEMLATEFTLNKGQGYLINNHRALHARNSFAGNRLMYRVLIDTSRN